MRRMLCSVSVVLPLVFFAQSSPASSESDVEATESPNTADTGAAANDQFAELWVRLVGVSIAEGSDQRQNGPRNPPNMYVVFNRNGEQIFRSSSISSWSSRFPVDEDHETVVTNDEANQYSIEVWDSRWGRDKQLFTIGPFTGSQWRETLANAESKQFEEGHIVTVQSDQDPHATVRLSFAGTRIWYRLVNVTIPPDSPYRKDENLNHPPRLQVTLRADGIRYGATARRQTGWSADFPKTPEHCWAVREGTQRRYTVEVWDNQYRPWGWHLIFSVSGLSAEDFRNEIRENVGQMLERDRASTVTFERIPRPF